MKLIWLSPRLLMHSLFAYQAPFNNPMLER
jgi:hypothetical protein